MAVRWHSSLDSCNYRECIFAVTSLLTVQIPKDLKRLNNLCPHHNPIWYCLRTQEPLNRNAQMRCWPKRAICRRTPHVSSMLLIGPPLEHCVIADVSIEDTVKDMGLSFELEMTR